MVLSLLNYRPGQYDLLSVAFDPNYQANGQFFVNYTRRSDGAMVIDRYTVSSDDPDRADGQGNCVCPG
jgi:hypothetical protein